MKFTKLLVLCGLSAACINAESNSTAGPVTKVAKFVIDYTVDGNPVGDSPSYHDLEVGQNTTLTYSFTNKESENVILVAVGGSILANSNGNVALVGNITESEVGRLEVGTNDTITFQQIIHLDFDVGQFYLLPSLFVIHEDNYLEVNTKPAPIRVHPPPISFLDPKFLFIQLTLLGIAILSYFYIFSKPATRKKPSKSAPIKVDQSWLPDIHKPKK